MDQSAIERLQAKSPEEAIVEQISRDFNLAPFMAKTQFELLCVSRSTIKRDIAQLRSEGLDVPTRGQIQDIGKGVSHKGRIVADWLDGYTYTDGLSTVLVSPVGALTPTSKAVS